MNKKWMVGLLLVLGIGNVVALPDAYESNDDMVNDLDNYEEMVARARAKREEKARTRDAEDSEDDQVPDNSGAMSQAEIDALYNNPDNADSVKLSSEQENNDAFMNQVFKDMDNQDDSKLGNVQTGSSQNETFIKQSNQALIDLQKEVANIQNEIYWISFWCKAKWVFLPIPGLHNKFYQRCVATKSDRKIYHQLEELERKVATQLPEMLPNSNQQNPLRLQLLRDLRNSRIEYASGKADSDNSRYKGLTPSKEQEGFYKQYAKALEDLMNRASDLQYKIKSTQWWCNLWLVPYLVSWCVNKYGSQTIAREYRKLRAEINALPDLPGQNDNAIKVLLLDMLDSENAEWLEEQTGL
jgi:hypothetical protein